MFFFFLVFVPAIIEILENIYHVENWRKFVKLSDIERFLRNKSRHRRKYVTNLFKQRNQFIAILHRLTMAERFKLKFESSTLFANNDGYLTNTRKISIPLQLMFGSFAIFS